MSQNSTRYTFSGHAVGAAAQFHRLDELDNLNHVVRTLGASVLPATGGLSQVHVPEYSYDVSEPRKRTLLSVRRIETTAAGRDLGSRYETEVEADIESLAVVEKLYIDRVRLHFLSVRDATSEDSEPVVTTNGSRIEGLRLGSVQVNVVLDDEPLLYCGTKNQLTCFYRKQTPQYRRAHSWRFGTDPDAAEIAEHKGHCKWSLVREIALSGPEDEKRLISVDGYTIVWKGFGRIVLGEIMVKEQERRLTMVRLAMGSDAGGSGSVGDGQSNGQLGT
jgi:hypothetical protein